MKNREEMLDEARKLLKSITIASESDSTGEKVPNLSIDASDTIIRVNEVHEVGKGKFIREFQVEYRETQYIFVLKQHGDEWAIKVFTPLGDGKGSVTELL